MREPEIIGAGSRDSGAGMMGPSGDELSIEMRGVVALSYVCQCWLRILCLQLGRSSSRNTYSAR